MRKDVCPICQHDLVKIRYLGNKRLHLSEERDSFEDYEEEGKNVFIENDSTAQRIAIARMYVLTDADSFPIDKMFPKMRD